MKSRSLSLVIASIATTMFSGAALADHNSPHGSGWANMPNDIHNIRIEDNLSSTEFRDIVQNGGANDTVNRYIDTTTSAVGNGGGGDRSSGDRSSGNRGGGRRK